MVAKKQNKNTKQTASFGKQKRKDNSKGNHFKDSGSIIDEKSKTDILAVALIIVGIALFAVALVPTTAPVTSFIILVLKYVVGVGVYIFPFALIICGASFFFRMERQKIPVRVCVGLSLIFVALLAIISLCNPVVADGRPQALFESDNIINYGGIIGSALA